MLSCAETRCKAIHHNVTLNFTGSVQKVLNLSDKNANKYAYVYTLILNKPKEWKI